ncbi:MAG: hypothetical protein HZC47_04615 [Methanobacterium sp.]|uniref:hypothetical protein n=1 Tax=Methanobacterium sp. TaxID=2164 RepID=UPI003D660EDB|nr:hypothetical protein [Methanobacterium sp.]
MVNVRKVIAIVVAVLVFILLFSGIAIGVQAVWPGYSFSDHPLERLILLGFVFFATAITYNIIKGKEPEQEHEIKEKKDKISSK